MNREYNNNINYINIDGYKYISREELNKLRGHNEKFLACKCGKKPEFRWKKSEQSNSYGLFYGIIPYKGPSGEEVCHKCALCVKCGKETYNSWENGLSRSEKTNDNPSGEWALAYCSMECFNGTVKEPRQVENCNYCGKWTAVKFGNTNTEKTFCSRDCYVAAGNKIQKGKCRIAGCSKKAYYECMDLCLGHSKPCQGTYMGKKCNLALGSDEGNFCERCKNQENRKRAEEHEGEFEKYKQAQEKAQSWWSTLSPHEREQECERVVENMKQEKYWANCVREGEGSGWACDGSLWMIENRKFTSQSPHLVPIQVVEEFQEKEIGFRDNKAIGWFGTKVVKVKKADSDNPPLKIEEGERIG